MCQIFLAMVLLNENAIFDIILSDENIIHTLSCLEYDPHLPPNTDHRRHRTNLAKYVSLRYNSRVVFDFRCVSVTTL